MCYAVKGKVSNLKYRTKSSAIKLEIEMMVWKRAGMIFMIMTTERFQRSSLLHRYRKEIPVFNFQ